MVPALRLTEQNVEAAASWGFNCGPGALCAVLGLTPEEVRPHLGDFERKHYTNPTLMFEALHSLGVEFTRRGPDHHGSDALPWPTFGLARIQWGGPWTTPGVPMAARYRKTHWVASATNEIQGTGIFDINILDWTPLASWRDTLVPWLLREAVPHADGRWWITHAVEVHR